MITALGPRLGLGLRLDFGSQVWFVQYFSEKKVIVLYALGYVGAVRRKYAARGRAPLSLRPAPLRCALSAFLSPPHGGQPPPAPSHASRLTPKRGGS